MPQLNLHPENTVLHSWHCAPCLPGGQAQAPVTWSQGSSGPHAQRSLHSSPKNPTGQTAEGKSRVVKFSQ